MGIFSSIFGGKGKSGYNSPYYGNEDNQMQGAISNMLGGVSQFKDPKDGRMKHNFAEGFKDLSGAKGVAAGSEGYDFSGLNSAKNTFSNPYKYNFGNDAGIDERTNLEYGMGAKDINRNANSSLEKIREAAGTRRPGLLMKAGEANARGAGENLAMMRSQLGSNAINQKLQLGKEQQMAQGDENYRNAGALADVNKSEIGIKSDLTERSRGYQDKIMDYINDLFKTTSGLTVANANSQNSGRSGGLMGSAVGAVSKFL